MQYELSCFINNNNTVFIYHFTSVNKKSPYDLQSQSGLTESHMENSLI